MVTRKLRCPECNSDHLIGSGHQFIARKKLVRHQCRSCGRFTLYPVLGSKRVAVLVSGGIIAKDKLRQLK